MKIASNLISVIELIIWKFSTNLFLKNKFNYLRRSFTVTFIFVNIVIGVVLVLVGFPIYWICVWWKPKPRSFQSKIDVLTRFFQILMNCTHEERQEENEAEVEEIGFIDEWNLCTVLWNYVKFMHDVLAPCKIVIVCGLDEHLSLFCLFYWMSITYDFLLIIKFMKNFDCNENR